jgi:hypothetical protein
MLLSEICGLVSVGRPFWQVDGSAICCAITQWSESRRNRNHTLLSHPRLRQPGGPGACIYIPQKQGSPVIPRALGSLYVASCDSQGYGGGIITLSNLEAQVPQEQASPVQSQSHVTTDVQSLSVSWSQVHAPLEGLHPNEFQSDIRRCTLRWICLCYHWEGCMWSMKYNVEFGFQLSICSGTKENHGKPWSSWPVAGPSGCKLTSSQQSVIKYTSPNTSP